MRAFSEELVCMILSIFFEFSNIRFFDHDVIHQLTDNASANNINNVADVLCVCKQWHRIGLVYLYNTIIIRSRAQALALATTLEEKPHLGLLIKNARIEGAYPRLDDIFKKCINLDIVNLLMWDILPKEHMEPLCRAFMSMNPVVFNFVDRCPDSGNSVNAKRSVNYTIVYKGLCSAISTWSRLVNFRCHWSDDYLTESHWPVSLLNYRIRLAEALSKSSSLRVVSTFAPLEWAEDWELLASIPTISFQLEFQCSYARDNYVNVQTNFEQLNRWDERVAIKFTNTGWMRVVSSEHFQGTVVPSTSQIMATPQIMAVPLTSTELAPRSVLPVTDNRRPHRFIRPSTCYSRIWSKIFLIALFDTADFDTIIGFLSGYINDYTVRNLIETRNTIRAVSCMWDAILQHTLAPHPLLFDIQDLVTLQQSCAIIPFIGLKVHLLTLNLLPYPADDTYPFIPGSLVRPTIQVTSIDTYLVALLRHLPNLVHLVSSPFYSISPSTFYELALCAGRTLRTIQNVYIASSPHGDRLPTAVVHMLQNLETLRFVVPPKWEVRQRDGTETFLELKCLGLETMSTCDTFYMMALYPALCKVQFSEVTVTVQKFLKLVGTQIRELGVVLTDSNARANGPYDLLGYCPNLETLVLGTKELDVMEQDLHFPMFLQMSQGHNSLKYLSINVPFSQTYLPCDFVHSSYNSPYNKIWSFFLRFKLEYYPNLREIRFDGYTWPDGYRHIKDNIIVDIAVYFGQCHDLSVVDRSGMPFRRRLQHRDGVLAERTNMYGLLQKYDSCDGWRALGGATASEAGGSDLGRRG